MFKLKQVSWIAVLLSVCILVSNLSWAISDGIVAVVGEEVITLKDVRQYIEEVYQQLKLEGHSSQEISDIMRQYEQNGLNQLVEDKLILEEANRQGMDIRQDYINKRLEDIKKNYKSEQEFLDALKLAGMSISDLRRKVVNQTKAKFLVDKEVHSKIFVNPQEVTDYYNKHQKEFTQKDRVNLDSIFISFEFGRDKAFERAQEAQKLLSEGKDFMEVAKEFSQSPSVGVVERGQMVASIEDEIFTLKTGGVSKTIEVDGGLYIFRVAGRLPFKIVTLQEAKTKIYNKIFQDKFKERFAQWIAKLRKKTYVEIKS